MPKDKLSPSLEDYLESIYVIKKEQDIVRATELAKRLNVSLPSVTEAVKKLSKKKLLKYKKYGDIVLSAEGKSIAKGVYHKHNLLLNFFICKLKVSKNIAERDACRIEHMLSPATLDKLTKFLDAK